MKRTTLEIINRLEKITPWWSDPILEDDPSLSSAINDAIVELKRLNEILKLQEKHCSK